MLQQKDLLLFKSSLTNTECCQRVLEMLPDDNVSKMAETPEISRDKKTILPAAKKDLDEPDLHSEISSISSAQLSKIPHSEHGKSPHRSSTNKIHKARNEVVGITKAYTVPQTEKNKHLKQLFVNDFSVSSFLNEKNNASAINAKGRPKRQLKAVMRFEAQPANFLKDKKNASSVKIGEGFSCPRCDHWLSYDVIECEECELKCKYQAGIGVVVFKNRNDITQKQGTKNLLEKVERKTITKKKEPENLQKNEVPSNDFSVPVYPVRKKPSKKQVGERQVIINKILNRQSYRDVLPDEEHNKECEVCFDILRPRSFALHRKRKHGLPSTEMGCPYCDATFKTPETRLLHINSKHSGNPAYGNAPYSQSQNQRAIFRCYLCWHSFPSLLDVYRHVVFGHISKFQLDKVKFVCPFCPRYSMVEPFITFPQLTEHVLNNHERCHLQQDLMINIIDEIGKETISSEETDRNDFQQLGTNLVLASNQIKSKRIINKEKTKFQRSKKKESSTEKPIKSWRSFSITELLNENACNKQFLIESMPNHGLTKKSNTEKWNGYDSEGDKDSICRALKTVEARLKTLKDPSQIKTFAQSSKQLEEEYVGELRLFKRGLRERTAKQEHERGDKEKYKAGCEADRLVHAYMNRNRKRTWEDMELASLEKRPVHFVSESMNLKKCKNGNCGLCGLAYAQTVLLDDEMDEANYEKKSLLNFMRTDVNVENPLYHEIEEDALLWPDENMRGGKNEWDDDLGFNEKRTPNVGRRLSVRCKDLRRRIGKVEEWERLRALRGTLIFLKRYNDGLMQNTKR